MNKKCKECFWNKRCSLQREKKEKDCNGPQKEEQLYK